MKTQFPDRISGDTLLGIAYLSTRDIDKAHEAFARAVGGEPEDPGAAGNLVNILVIEGKTEEARAVLDRVLEADPAHLNSLLTAAGLAERAGDNARAEALWNQAIEHHPDALQPRVMLGNHYITSDRPAEALKVAEPALVANRSEEHTSELQSLLRISYAVFCLKKKNKKQSNIKQYLTQTQHTHI